jgi:hypothetical protein
MTLTFQWARSHKLAAQRDTVTSYPSTSYKNQEYDKLLRAHYISIYKHTCDIQWYVVARSLQNAVLLSDADVRRCLIFASVTYVKSLIFELVCIFLQFVCFASDEMEK